MQYHMAISKPHILASILRVNNVLAEACLGFVVWLQGHDDPESRVSRMRSDIVSTEDQLSNCAVYTVSPDEHITLVSRPVREVKRDGAMSGSSIDRDQLL